MVTIGQTASQLNDENERSFSKREGKIEQDAINVKEPNA